MNATIIATIIKESFSIVKLYYKEKNKRLHVNSTHIEEAIENHVHYINSWSSDISFRDLKSPHLLENIYVDLDYQFLSNRLSFKGESKKSITLSEIFTTQERNIVILGLPGSGKTTSVKKLCHLILYDESFLPEIFNIPLLIRLRDFNKEEIYQLNSNYLFQKIFQLLGLKINLQHFKTELEKKIEFQNVKELIEKATIQFLDSLKVLLILDGFDEITDENKRKYILDDFQELSLRLSRSRIALTSRTGEFHYNVDNTVEYEIRRLNSNQITAFINKYVPNKKKARKLRKQIIESPYADTASKPLTIAHLCAIFDRYGKIPEKPKSVYRKVVNLYLEEWNAQNMISRVSKYGNFEIDRKFEFLCHLSYFLSIVHNSYSFSKDLLSDVYQIICKHYALPKNQAQRVVNEIESHTGLFIQTGYESFEFAHKSIQEYLTAEYIVKLPYFFSKKEDLGRIPNELALAVALSSNPTYYFSDLIIQKLKNFSLRTGFFYSFIQRLIIEKPDFIVDEVLAISFFYLFTLNRTESSGETNNEFFNLMEKFKLLNGLKESLGLISESYKIAKKREKVEDFQMVVLLEDYRNSEFKELPKYLFIPQNMTNLWE